MITDIDAFLRYFDGVHRRALRDIGALPPEAERCSRRWSRSGSHFCGEV